MEKSDKIAASSATDRILVAILSSLEGLNNVFGKGGSGATTPLILNSVEYTDTGAHLTTSGKNTIMITCVTGIETIDGIVMPAGVYTFQPTLSGSVDTISVDALGGRVIVQEL